LLLALALESAEPAQREELLGLIGQSSAVEHCNGQRSAVPIVERVRALFTQAQVFEKADGLIDKFRARAEAVADEVRPEELRELLYYLVDTVLERQCSPAETEAPPLIQLTR
jgi:geranylgeranyl pyrophosphate synthase